VLQFDQVNHQRRFAASAEVSAWEFQDNYRELSVFETRALRAVMEAWKLNPVDDN
jgi:hypothetical protein